MYRQKECDSERVGCREESDARRLRKAEVPQNVCHSFPSMRVCGRERETYMEENRLVL